MYAHCEKCKLQSLRKTKKKKNMRSPPSPYLSLSKHTQKCDFIYLGEIPCSKYMYQKRKLSVSITNSKLPSLARIEDSPPNINTVKTRV